LYFLYGKGKENHKLGKVCFVHHRIVSAAKTVGYVCDRISYIVLRGSWCDIIVLNVHVLYQVRRKEMIQKTGFMRK
jgi:hypothetical protein